MAKKKEKSVLEEVKEAAEKVAGNISGAVEELAEDIKKAVEGKKENEKKSSDKKESSKEKEEKKEAKETETKTKTKLEELKEKAKALEEKVKEAKKIDIKKEVTGEKEGKKDTLVPIEEYLKSSIYLGTKVITPNMRTYVYRRRADGLAVFNTELLDEKLREGAEYLSRFAPENIVVMCKREAGWKSATKFSETLGIKFFTKKYPAGTLTNTNLRDFFEKELVFICDPWLDKNALHDANKIKIPVLSICDTNNYTFGISKIIPGNNKSAKSLGMIFYLLTKLYIEKRKLNIKTPPIQEFIDGWEEIQ